MKHFSYLVVLLTLAMLGCKKEETKPTDIRDQVVGEYNVSVNYQGEAPVKLNFEKYAILKSGDNELILAGEFVFRDQKSWTEVYTFNNLSTDSNVITFDMVPYLPDTTNTRIGINFDGSSSPKKAHGYFNLKDGTLKFAFREKWWKTGDFVVMYTNCFYSCTKK